MKKLLHLFLVFPALCFSQASLDVDSLKIELANEKDEEVKIHLKNLIGEYGEIGRYGYWDSIIYDAEKSGYKSELIYAFFMQSINYTNKGILDQAIFYSEKSLTLATEIKDSIWIGYAIEHLGFLNGLLGETSISIKYFKQAHKLYLSRKDQWRIGHVLIRIAEIYQEKNDFNESMCLYRESLELFKQTKDTSGLTIAYNHIGKVFREKKQLDSALVYMHKSLDLRNNFQDQYYLSYTLNDLALTYLELGDLNSMFTYIHQSEKEVNRIGNEGFLRQKVYELYLQYYRFKKDYKNALKYKDLSVSIRDSLNKKDNQKAVINQQFKFEYETRKTIDDAENEKVLAVEKEKQKKQFIILIIIIPTSCFVLILLIIIYRKLQITKKQKVIIEDAHKEITDSINYAERIQHSFLATKELLTANLDDYFVFFQPKEAVSGDFYWARELSNDNFVMVNADSTGHGVPGAIMSILNISSIEKAVEKGLTNTSEIFNDARKTIIERLKKDGSDEGGKDGMDASIIAFDKKNNKITYTAAQTPIWIIRDKEVIQLKPEKMPIGKHANDDIPFIGGEFKTQKGDLVYTLTDGYPDQFGGPKGKKFMVKKMREYILSISHLPMSEQYIKIKETFNNWKGELEQIDDVCVIGVRI